MSLKVFHLVFIILAILMALVCAAWAFVNQVATAFGVCSTVSAFILVVYGIWFVRKSRNIIT